MYVFELCIAQSTWVIDVSILSIVSGNIKMI